MDNQKTQRYSVYNMNQRKGNESSHGEAARSDEEKGLKFDTTSDSNN